MDNPVEAQRNRLLRRADWRYLMSNPWPPKSTCFGGELLAQAVQTISTQYIPPDAVQSGECDLIAATNPDRAALHKAWQALRPGGNFYSEWVSPLAGGALGVHQRLEAAGFVDVVCYWPWPVPGFSPALFWLPLEAPQAVRYFLSSRPLPTHPAARLGHQALQMLWSLAWRSRLLVPVCATARKADSSPKTHFLDEELFAQLGVGELRQPDYLLWTGGRRSINKVVLYRFAAGEAMPGVVVKMPRIAEAAAALRHEAHILQSLHARKREAAAHAPAVLFLQEWGGMPALGETAFFGQPLYAVMKKENILGLAIQVTEWLASLAMDGPVSPRPVWWERLVEPALGDFEQSFGSVLAPSVLPGCRAILNRLSDLPQAFEHRDCSPWNLLITSDGELAVLDWESAEPEGLPGLDLAYFLAYLAFFLEGAMKTGNFIEAYRHSLAPATFTGRLQAVCQQRYIERTGLDPVVWQPLRLLAWLIHARSEIRQLSADTGGLPQPNALRSSLFYTLILEELTRASLGGEGG
jgi:hypothetical protein